MFSHSKIENDHVHGTMIIIYIYLIIVSSISDIGIPTTMLYSTFDNPVDAANSSCKIELHLRLVDDCLWLGIDSGNMFHFGGGSLSKSQLKITNSSIGKLWSVNENPVDGLPIFCGHWRARYFYGYWRSWKEWESCGNTVPWWWKYRNSAMKGWKNDDGVRHVWTYGKRWW